MITWKRSNERLAAALLLAGAVILSNPCAGVITNGVVMISTNTAWAEEQYVIQELTVGNGATLAVAGGSTLEVAGTFAIVGSNSAVRCEGKNRAGMVNSNWLGVGVVIFASNVVVEAGARLHADGQGYTSVGLFQRGNGPGGGAGGGGAGGGGGGYGGRGGDGNGGGGGGTYGSQYYPGDLGSGGGCGDNGTPTGHGGGAITLNVADTLTLDGVISANGLHGTANDCAGGAGGSILVRTGTLNGSGRFTANGGNGTTWAGAGGGGRIAVYYRAQNFSGFTNSTVSAGTPRPGGAGTIA
ncbi:MAG: hypothetical protein N2595_08660, partial [bacterium]|nr:hypothetical protein [bacterium]